MATKTTRQLIFACKNKNDSDELVLILFATSATTTFTKHTYTHINARVAHIFVSTNTVM